MFEITGAGNVHYCNQMQYMSTSQIFAYQLEYVYNSRPTVKYQICQHN